VVVTISVPLSVIVVVVLVSPAIIATLMTATAETIPRGGSSVYNSSWSMTVIVIIIILTVTVAVAVAVTVTVAVAVAVTVTVLSTIVSTAHSLDGTVKIVVVATVAVARL
jgi:hypothetical protein